MSGPIGSAAPGWYADPDGAPGMVRWWNGASWSDVTTPSGPGVRVERSFGDAPAQRGPQPSWEAWGAQPDAPARRPRRRPLLIGLGALGVVLLLVLLAVVTGGGEEAGEEADEAPVASSSSRPTSTFPPGTVRIIDEAAGISYPFLGEGWYEWDRDAQFETTETAGQYFVTQEGLPGNEVFIAQCTSGPLATDYGWAGAASLQSTVSTVAGYARVLHYPAPNEQSVRRDEAVTVDGAAGWVYEFDLTWDVAGYDSSGERAALLLIDVGKPQPALLYISIPNTHAELYGVIDRVLADVDVL